MLDSCVSLFLEIVIFPQNCWSSSSSFQICCYLYNFATRMSICRLPADFSVFLIGEGKELAAHVGRSGGKGTRTPDIQLAKLALYQLSYAPRILERKDRDSCRRPRFRGVDLRTSVLLLHRKEVIQPQVPLRLPCYDFIPVTSLTLGPCLLTVGS